MLLNLPELETGEELDRLSTLLATEEQSGSSQDLEIDNQIAQIILRREGEDRISYGKRVDRFINYIQFLNQTNFWTWKSLGYKPSKNREQTWQKDSSRWFCSD
jgi:hypothetical protein